MLDPSGRQVYTNKDHQQGIIRFPVKQEGLYRFIVSSYVPCQATLVLQLPSEENFDDLHEDTLLQNPDWQDAWFENK